MTATAPTRSGMAPPAQVIPLPRPRGPLSAHVLSRLTLTPGAAMPQPHVAPESSATDDFQLALYICYELHYRSFTGVDDRWEWDLGLLSFRAELEAVFEAAVAGAVAAFGALAADPPTIGRQLWALASSGSGPSLSAFVESHATLDQVRELAAHRSAYQLKEADPHTWAIPRLTLGTKAAMVEIQTDEYGCGRESDMHASLFGVTMDELGLDSTYGAYLDWLPGATLATVNLISLFGLHRRLRGALVGHLAIFEMTSVGPMGRYSRALARLGVASRARRFYDVHVEADAHHELVAHDMACRMAADEPAVAGDILFGGAALMVVERAFADHVLDSWAAGRCSLRQPLRRTAGV